MVVAGGTSTMGVSMEESPQLGGSQEELPSPIPPPGENQEEHFATLVLEIVTDIIEVTT